MRDVFDAPMHVPTPPPFEVPYHLPPGSFSRSPPFRLPHPRRRAANRRRLALAAALEERDVTLGVLLQGGVGGVGGMGLSVGQRMALEHALSQIARPASAGCCVVGEGG